MTEISHRDARRLLLASQGLLHRVAFGRGKQAVLRAIEQLGYVQIDTISVVERAHHHVLQTRVPDYDPRMLDQLQGVDRSVFEYWSHAAAYLPMRDYRFYRPMMAGFARRTKADAKLSRRVLDRIHAEGPLQAKDFEQRQGRSSSGWWDWKPAKRALESLFLGGDLMISRRQGFQKVYDLTAHVLPAGVDTRAPTIPEWGKFIASNNLRALGIGTAHDIGYARLTMKRFSGEVIAPHIHTALNELVDSGAATRSTLGGETVFISTPLMDQLPFRLGKRRITFLSPFDNVIINRRRLQHMFGFDYLIECYVPAPKRQYGYFCLPMLWGDELIGRLDAKAVRKAATLDVQCLFLEPGVKVTASLTAAISAGLDQFAKANHCDQVRVLRTVPKDLYRSLPKPGRNEASTR
jgi:uncharacterized protein